MPHANERPALLCRGRLPLSLSLQLTYVVKLVAVSSDVTDVLQEKDCFFSVGWIPKHELVFTTAVKREGRSLYCFCLLYSCLNVFYMSTLNPGDTYTTVWLLEFAKLLMVFEVRIHLWLNCYFSCGFVYGISKDLSSGDIFLQVRAKYTKEILDGGEFLAF